MRPQFLVIGIISYLLVKQNGNVDSQRDVQLWNGARPFTTVVLKQRATHFSCAEKRMALCLS